MGTEPTLIGIITKLKHNIKYSSDADMELRSFDDHLCIEEGACGLEGELERSEFEGQLVALSALEEAALELGGVLEDVAVEGVEQEHLVCGDDAADLLEVDDDGALAAQDRGRVHEERVEQAEVPRGEVAAPHHGGLVDLQRLHGGRGGFDAVPAARAAAVFLEVGDVEFPLGTVAGGPQERGRGGRRDVGRVRAVEERLFDGVPDSGPGGGHGAVVASFVAMRRKQEKKKKKKMVMVL